MTRKGDSNRCRRSECGDATAHHVELGQSEISSPHTHTHIHTHTRVHARTHAHTHGEGGGGRELCAPYEGND